MNSPRLNRSNTTASSQSSRPRNLPSGAARPRISADGRDTMRPVTRAPTASDQLAPVPANPNAPGNPIARRNTQIEQRMGAIERMLIDPALEERRRGVTALAELQGRAAMPRLVNMALREPAVRVVDAIISVMRQHGTARQVGMTLYRQAARPELHAQGIDLLVKHPGEGAQRQQVYDIIHELLGAASIEQRVQGVNAHAALEGPAGIDRLVQMAPREHSARVVDAIIAAVREHGTQRQIGLTLYGQGMKPALHQPGLTLLVQNPGDGAQRQQVRNIITELLRSKDPEQRRQGVLAHATLEGAAGMQLLVVMGARERMVRVVDAIIDAVQQHGNLRQLGMTYWTQAVRPNLQQQGLDLLVRYPGDGRQLEQVRGIISDLCDSSNAEDRVRGLRAHAALEGTNATARLRSMSGDNSYRVAEAARTELRSLAASAPRPPPQQPQVFPPPPPRSQTFAPPPQASPQQSPRPVMVPLAPVVRVNVPPQTSARAPAPSGIQGQAPAWAQTPAAVQAAQAATQTPATVHGQPSAQAQATASTHAPLAEADVIEAFHNILRPGLTQAVARDRLFTLDDVQSIEPALVVAAPALALVHAALNSHDDTVTAPLNDGRTLTLTASNCPESLQVLFTRWSLLTAQIRALSPGDVAALRDFISNRDSGTDAPPHVRALGTQLVGLGITISQRRTFQRLFTADLSHVEGASAQPKNTPPPSDLDPIMDSIRETLYAALATSIESVPELGALLDRDPARGYLGTVAFALLDVLSGSVDSDGVHLAIVSNDSPRQLNHSNCPALMRPLLQTLLQTRALSLTLPPSALTQVRALLLSGNVPTADRRALALATALSTLATQITTLPRFVSTAGEVFAILKAFSA